MGALDGKVTFTTSEHRPCWVDGRRAVFHRWLDNARPVKPRGHEDDPEVAYFPLHNVHALVEFEDGIMRRVWPTDLQFADSAELFATINWDGLEGRRDALPFTVEDEREEPAPIEKGCNNCAHCEDGDPEVCESVKWTCSRCTASCYCAGCTDHDKWEPEGQGNGAE